MTGSSGEKGEEISHSMPFSWVNLDYCSHLETQVIEFLFFQIQFYSPILLFTVFFYGKIIRLCLYRTRPGVLVVELVIL